MFGILPPKIKLPRITDRGFHRRDRAAVHQDHYTSKALAQVNREGDGAGRSQLNEPRP
jgi:hypothetical protein